MKKTCKALVIFGLLGFMPLTGAQAHGVRPYFPPAETKHKQGRESTENHEYVKLEETRKIARDSTGEDQAPRVKEAYESGMNSGNSGTRAMSSGSVY